MKPFLLLQSRPEDEASDNEYEGFLQASGLEAHQLERVRVEAAPLPHLKLDDYSGVIIGGGPFNISDPEEKKSDVQKRVEVDLARVLSEITEKDFPLFGACFGVGTLGAHQGALISRKYGEEVQAASITLTDAARYDPLLAGIPETFQAIVGHKESCEILPDHAVLLASSPTCRVQMFRIKNNLYATQFHPELDMMGLKVRLMVYRDAGYFPPEDMEQILESVETADLSHAPRLLQNFVKHYQR